MNRDERIKIERIDVNKVSVAKIALDSVFGIPNKAFELVDDEEPFITLEDGGVILMEDSDKLTLEKDKVKVYVK